MARFIINFDYKMSTRKKLYLY